MPQWLNILVGSGAGIAIVGTALAWACWPRTARGRSWFAPPTGDAGDPTPGGTQWSGDGQGGGHDGGGGHGGW